jgi:AAA domain/UvrD-like helicase C-terminal domain
MPIAIEQTFFKSWEALDNVSRGRVLEFVSRFQANPANPGCSFERIETNKKCDLWSARITQGLRAIVYHEGDEHILLFAGKHDDAYAWARRRKVDRHAITGQARIIELPETVEEQISWGAAPAGLPKLFAAHTDDYLRSIGAPEELLSLVRTIETEDQLLQVIEKLPPDFAENLMLLAGGSLVVPPIASTGSKSLVPESNQRFWVVADAADLADLLNKPFEVWMRYLHPSQSQMVHAKYSGAVKITGAAGTGKTVVAMHRAKMLVRQGKQVLLTTFVKTLCRNIGRSLDLLLTKDERKMVTVNTVGSEALAIVKEQMNVSAAEQSMIEELIKRHAHYAGSLTPAFLISEWRGVIDRQGISSWDEYRDALRTGRGKPLSAGDRKAAWSTFSRVLEELRSASLLPWFMVYRNAEKFLAEGKVKSRYDAVLVDESQDCGAPEVRFLAALSASTRADLMLVGDVGQRIYAGGYSLQKLGIDVRGRSKVLRINYRTTRQIQRVAERLRAVVDEDAGEKTNAQSLLNGPEPVFRGFSSEDDREDFLASEVPRLLAEGLRPREIAIFLRTNAAVESMRSRLSERGIATTVLDKTTDVIDAEHVLVGTMHRAKGLEFKSVYAAQCDRDSLPLRKALLDAGDEAERREVLELERQLLYVTLTRARDHATVTWVGDPSPYVEQIRIGETS